MTPDTLKQMLADQDSAGKTYHPSAFWQECTREILGLLEDKGVENFRQFPYFNPEHRFWLYKKSPRFFNALRTMVPEISIGRKIARGMDNLFFGLYAAQENYRIYLGADKANDLPMTRNFTSSRVGNPLTRDVYKIDGKLFTRASLMYLKGLAMLKKNCDLQGIKTVFEVGGGYGALGEIMLKAEGDNYFYINVDIPPTAYFSTYYLQGVFGKDAVLDYSQSRDMTQIDIAEISKKYRAVVLCPWQVEKLVGQIDLAVNYTSFQEMEAAVVMNYAAQISRLGAKFVLTRNKKNGIHIRQINGEPMIGKRVTMDDIVGFFAAHGYELRDRDAIAFGDGLPGISQEAAVMSRNR